MPQIRPKNLSATDGYSAYLSELDVLLSPDTFVDFVLEQLHNRNWIYWTNLAKVKEINPLAFATHVLQEVKFDYPRYMPYLNDAELIDPAGYAEYVSYEIEACYAIKAADTQHQQSELRAQIATDEEKAMVHLSELRSKESDYEDMLLREAAIQIFEFFGPDYNDGLFYAGNTAELDKVLASEPRYEKPRSVCIKRRRNNAYYKRRLRENASNAKKTFVRRLDKDSCPTGNCAGLIVNHPSLATLKAQRIWKRARKNGYVSGEIIPATSNWRKQLLRHRKFYYVNPKK